MFIRIQRGNFVTRRYKYYVLFGSLIIFEAIYVMFFLLPTIRDPKMSILIVTMICSAFLVFLFIAVYVFFKGIKESIQNAHKLELLEVLQDYTSNLEKMYDEMRKFRHDYINIIAAQ